MKCKQGNEDKQTTDVNKQCLQFENKSSNNQLAIRTKQWRVTCARQLTNVYTYMYVYVCTRTARSYMYVHTQHASLIACV